ncbi:hypothetical protein A2188_00910 [Candidatus Woesebacteria bacterium RIFOXYA1_FULL_43_9]|uniref:DUF1648 domain-containing protein n=1 Tax=Candidatus Woesebacteria bacterium RIFOXYA1_FULL_43_9 TaxID=1802534 RepID=A0A1F8CPD1_9BACT|nr:MAG: hypothetical protein A2188_00910 [Candidatus Woesebacteria bacterium RIFOXYA1_FULL_43_9]
MRKEVVKSSIYNLAVIINILGLVISVITAFFLLPPVIPLFYGNLQTTSQITSRFLYPLPIVLSLGFSLINKLVDKETDLFLTSICKTATLITTIFAIVTLIKIYLLVGYRLV